MKKSWMRIGVSFGALALAIAAAWTLLFRVNTFSLEVTLKGPEKITLEYGEAFREPGASATLVGSLFFREGIAPGEFRWTVNGKVAPSRLGTYPVEYTASVWGYSGSAVRQVEIVDTQPPVITLTEEGASAMDNCDGDVTERILRTETPGLIRYSVEDSSGNTATLCREIPLEDVAPELYLEGGAHITIPAGTPYVDPGFWAGDETGDLTEAVEVSGEVVWYLCGTYPVVYTVRDAGGNETTATRQVEVKAVDRPRVIRPENRTVYLTFDDGPGPYTKDLLDILDEYNVKATFFVTDSDYADVMKEIVERGHSIGIHTVSHDYASIYESPEAYFADLYQMQEIIYEKTGVRTTLMRFPGGSSNTVSRRYHKGIMSTLAEAVQDAGFQFFDWNIDSNDAGGATDPETVTENVIRGIRGQGTGIVLQHDIHGYSVAAVEDIILWALDNGCRFAPLTENTPGFHHGVNN